MMQDQIKNRYLVNVKKVRKVLDKQHISKYTV